MLDRFTMTIKIDTSNAAFGATAEQRCEEIRRILLDQVDVASGIQISGERNLYDYNGNLVGTAVYKRTPRRRA